MTQLKPVIAFNSQQPDQEAVYRLQAALQYFIDNRNDLIIADGLRVRFSEERSRLEYGYATIAILRATQRALGLVESDSVNADTAAKINAHLATVNMLAPEPSSERSNRVSGIVRNALGMPLAGIKVEAFDRDLRDAQYLGEYDTDANGRYEIQYASSETAPGEAGTADLMLRLSREKSKYLHISEPWYNAPSELEWDITLQSNSGLRRSEFSDILDAVLPLLPGQGVSIADLQETETHRDLSFLHRETGIDARLLALFILAHRYGRQLAEDYANHPIAPALLYAWMRAGLPQEMENLLPVGKQQKRAALDLAIQENIVEAWYDRPGIDDDVEYIARNYAPAVRYSNGELLGTLFSNDWALQQQVLQILEGQPGAGANLSQLLAQTDADEQTRRRVLLNNELLTLTLNNAQLAQILDNNSDENAGRFTDLLRQPNWKLYEAGDWHNLIGFLDDKKYTSFIAGETEEEQRNNYAALLAGIINFNFPTETLAERVIREEMPLFRPELREGVGQFLHNAARTKGFHIGTTDLTAFFKRPDAFEGFSGDRETLKSEIVRLRQVFQLTPDDAKAAVLLRHGLDSAAKIAALPLAEFAERAGAELGGVEWAEAIHNKAVGVRATEAYWQLALKARQMTVPLFALDGAPAAQLPVSHGPVDVAAIQQFLGNFDLCECLHCESITSPAAYLVDLLKYLPDNARAALFGRRPDLQFIPLDCDSTDTIVPYIDLVNEILEYYIVHQALDESTPAANLPGMTQERILSQPQRVQQAAYQLLLERKHPLGLPFDRDWELLRLFARTNGNRISDLLGAALEHGARSESALLASLDISVREKTGVYDRITDPAALPELFGSTPTEGQTPGSESAAVLLNESLSQAEQFLQRTGLTFQELADTLKSAFINGAPRVDNPVILSMEHESTRCSVQGFTMTHLDGSPLTLEEWGKLYFFVRLKRHFQWSVQDLDIALTIKRPGEGYGDFLVKLAWYGLAAKELGAASTIDFIRNGTVGSETPILRQAFKLSEEELNRIRDIADANRNNRPGEPRFYQVIQVAKELEAEKIPLTRLEYLLFNEGPESRLSPERKADVDAFILTLHRQLAEVNDMFAIPAEPDVLQTRDRLRRIFDETDTDFILGLVTGRGVPSDENLDRMEGLLRAFIEPGNLNFRDDFRAPELRHLKTLMEMVTPHLVGSEKKERLWKLLTERLNISAGHLDALISEEKGVLQSAYLAERAAIADFLFTVPETPESAQFSDWSGDMSPGHFYAVVPADGKYQVLARIGGAEEGAIVRIDETDFMFMATDQLQKIPGSPDFDWYAGRLVRFKISRSGSERLVQFYWQAPPLPPQPISEVKTLPAYQVNSILNQLYRLERAAFFIRHYQLLPEDIGATTRINNFWAYLPGKDPHNAWAQGLLFYGFWRQLSAYVLLRNEWTGGKESLAGVLGDQSGETVSAVLHAWSGMKQEDWDALSAQFDLNLVATRLQTLRNIRRCIGLSRQTGLSPATVAAISRGEYAGLEAEISYALANRFFGKNLQEKTKEIFDALRERQRDALIAYLLETPDQPNGENWKTAADLYEYFLIDVEMGACMQTSRIRLALSSVQMFIQRCLLNLEQGTALPPDKTAEWPWRKNYRVWEANRKVLLFPENWLDPEFRTEKSEIFEQLESELLQGDISDEAVEKALANYLDGLNAVSKLEICGLHIENKGRGDEILHVIGRTPSNSISHYYRRWENGAWTFWEKIECNIDGQHVMPVIWGGSLFIFWLTFLEKSQTDGEKGSLLKMAEQSVSRYSQVQLAWTEYRYGKWQMRKESQLTDPIVIGIDSDPAILYQPYVRARVRVASNQVFVDVFQVQDNQANYQASYRLSSRIGPVSKLSDTVSSPVRLYSFDGAVCDYNLLKLPNGGLRGTVTNNPILLPPDAGSGQASVCIDSGLLNLNSGTNVFFFQNSQSCYLVKVNTTESEHRSGGKSYAEIEAITKPWEFERLAVPVNPVITQFAPNLRSNMVRFDGISINRPGLASF